MPKESEVYYRNKKKAKEENIRKNEGSDVCESLKDHRVYAASLETTSGPLSVNSSKTCDAWNEEVAQMEQIPDTNVLQPVIDSTNL